MKNTWEKFFFSNSSHGSILECVNMVFFPASCRFGDVAEEEQLSFGLLRISKHIRF